MTIQNFDCAFPIGRDGANMHLAPRIIVLDFNPGDYAIWIEMASLAIGCCGQIFLMVKR
jgi:hypothetical protein